MADLSHHKRYHDFVKADCWCQILELGLKEWSILKLQSPKIDKSLKTPIYFILFYFYICRAQTRPFNPQVDIFQSY